MTRAGFAREGMGVEGRGKGRGAAGRAHLDERLVTRAAHHLQLGRRAHRLAPDLLGPRRGDHLQAPHHRIERVQHAAAERHAPDDRRVAHSGQFTVGAEPQPVRLATERLHALVARRTGAQVGAEQPAHRAGVAPQEWRQRREGLVAGCKHRERLRRSAAGTETWQLVGEARLSQQAQQAPVPTLGADRGEVS